MWLVWVVLPCTAWWSSGPPASTPWSSSLTPRAYSPASIAEGQLASRCTCTSRLCSSRSLRVIFSTHIFRLNSRISSSFLQAASFLPSSHMSKGMAFCADRGLLARRCRRVSAIGVGMRGVVWRATRLARGLATAASSGCDARRPSKPRDSLRLRHASARVSRFSSFSTASAWSRSGPAPGLRQAPSPWPEAFSQPTIAAISSSRHRF
mmetsp:Transcript_15476/g.38649  ORF Transcript_15476/g.38649 Transcript_15476/m.38649 type:complete len:208 (+) Transcript_15476:367-990(+)